MLGEGIGKGNSACVDYALKVKPPGLKVMEYASEGVLGARAGGIPLRKCYYP